MYIPKQFQQDKESLIKAIKEIKLGALIIFSEGNFFINHIPFIIKEDAESIILEGHVAKANEIWKVANPQNKTTVIFQGAHSYIHPNWYPSKAKNHKSVPTWNYQAVHCYGHSQSQQSEEWILNHLIELTNHNEKSQTNPWSVSDAPDQYIKDLVKGIIGIRIKVEKIEGALKMSQNHPEENRLGVIDGLSKSQKPSECEVARLMIQIEADRKKF